MVCLVSAVLSINMSSVQCRTLALGYGVKACAPPEGNWTQAETRIWVSACKTGEADAEELGLAPQAGRAYSTISGSFVQLLLTNRLLRRDFATDNLVIRHVRVKEPVRIIAGQILGGISFIDSHFDGLWDFSESEVKGSISFLRTSFYDGFRARRVHIHGSLVLGSIDDDDAHADKAPSSKVKIKYIYATHAEIDRDLSIVGAITGPITFSYSTISGTINLENIDGREILLSSCVAGGQVAIIEDVLIPSGSRLGGNKYFLLSLFGLRTPDSVFLNRSSISGSLLIDEASIGGSLHLVGVELSDVSAVDAVIGQQLTLGPNFFAAKIPVPMRWKGLSRLDLSHAHVGRVSAPRNWDAWPLHIQLRDFIFESFSSDASDNRLVQLSPSVWFPQWLSRATSSSYNPEPYQEVIRVLQAAGEQDAASSVGFAARDRERSDACNNYELLNCIYLTFSKFAIGYGYEMYWAVIWSGLFVVVGAGIFQETTESKIYKMPFGLAYSFDIFIPIIKLREKHYKIDIEGRARYYFFIHKLAGWILGSFLVAGLSGFTK
jgi:hypothetical protein